MGAQSPGAFSPGLLPSPTRCNHRRHRNHY